VESRIARRALGVALAAGIGADILFDRTALGINVPIATVAALALVTWFGPGWRTVDRSDLWLPGLALVASLGPMFRTDPSVVALDAWLVAAAIAAWSFAVSGVAVTRGTARAAAWLGVTAGVAVATALLWLAAKSGADGAYSTGSRQLGRFAPAARGAIIAVPVVLGFAVLLGSADAVFGRALDDALRLPNLDELIGRGVFTLLAAALIAAPIAIAAGAASRAGSGLFVAGVAKEPPPAPPPAPLPEGFVATESPPEPVTANAPVAASAPATAPAPAHRAGATEAFVVLLAVDALFGLFAIVQVVYLFGGRDTLTTIGMSYSDYARQGYFQLAFVVGLAGLLLLGAHEVMGRTRRFLWAGLALLLLTGVILASAALRLRLYQDAYGWTELRFFVAASIAWLAAGVGITIGLILANRMRWVAHGLAISAVAITLAVSIVGPQAFVMQQNIARALDPALVPEGGHSGLDIEYGLTLGDDAVPALVDVLPRLPDVERKQARFELELRRATMADDQGGMSPFAWNLAREQARAALDRLPPP
jgi:hypothetical protein